MGGHGGLNILPQKSWNVYGYFQRKKVENDLKKAAEKKEKTEKREIEGQSDLRLRLLRNKMMNKTGGKEMTPPPSPPPLPIQKKFIKKSEFKS